MLSCRAGTLDGLYARVLAHSLACRYYPPDPAKIEAMGSAGLLICATHVCAFLRVTREHAKRARQHNTSHGNVPFVKNKPTHTQGCAEFCVQQMSFRLKFCVGAGHELREMRISVACRLPKSPVSCIKSGKGLRCRMERARCGMGMFIPCFPQKSPTFCEKSMTESLP